MFSFACQKRTRKAPATFEAREARIKGCSPLIIPKKMGSIQKIQVAPLKDFLCYADLQSLTRRNVRATACFHADANAPAGSQRRQMPFAVTAFPVKTQCRAVRKTARHCSIINNSSADATATTAACGRSREELLGPWPAGCKARSRAVAAAGCHNSSKAKRRAF